MKISPELSIGTANFNNQYGIYKKTSIKKAEQEILLDNAWNSGFTSIDTAVGYKDVHQSLSKLHSFKKHQWKLTTKIPSIELETSKEKTISWVISLIEESLNDYKIDIVDTVLLHDPKIQMRPTELKYTLKGLDLAYESGLIAKYGISLYEPTQSDILIKYFNEKDSFVIQGPMNLFDRRMEQYTSCNNSSLKFEARSIFLQGMLIHLKMFQEHFGKIPELLNFKSWLDKSGISPLEACISFAKYSNADKIILGFGNNDELTNFYKVFKAISNFNPPVFCNDENIMNPLNWKSV